MAPSTLQYRRTHNLLLINKLLSQRESASPFTLVLDSLEQSGRPLIAKYIHQAKAARLQPILVSFETLEPPHDVAFIAAWRDPSGWQKEVVSHLKDANSRKLLIFDNLNTLAATEAANLPSLLSSFLSPTTSLVAVYHLDVPHIPPKSQHDLYVPTPLKLLKFLATTIFTMHSLHHVVARKAARDRSQAEPSFGLEEGIEGVLQGQHANGLDGVVLEMEHRRRSGRGVREWFVLEPPAADPTTPTSRDELAVMLLEDHSLYRSTSEVHRDSEIDAETQGLTGSTFDLSLTDRQRQDREGVVLPYFDAQKGGSEGGRILYDMGSEDDFDEEEDEI